MCVCVYMEAAARVTTDKYYSGPAQGGPVVARHKRLAQPIYIYIFIYIYIYVYIYIYIYINIYI